MNYKMLIIGHANYPSGMVSALNYVGGFEAIDTLHLDDAVGFDQFEEQLHNYLDQHPQTLIIADLAGGSPHQLAHKLISEHKLSHTYLLVGAAFGLVLNLAFKVFFNAELTTAELKTFIHKELEQLNRYTLFYGVE